MEKYLGRKIKLQKSFDLDETFHAYWAAELWLTNNGYGFGSMSSPLPTAITKGNYSESMLPQKWKNFNKMGKDSVHGVIVADTGSFRTGPVTIYLFE